MRTFTGRLLNTCIAGALVLVNVGCSPAAPPANSIVVGSKEFTENILLGTMLVIALESAGIPVHDRTNFGDTQQNRDSLLAGTIDVYPEYNTTGYTVHLGGVNPTWDGRLLFQQVASEDLAANDIRWVGRSPFNNTYGFASSPEATEANRWLPFTFTTMGQYLEANPDQQVCVADEFASRPDGLALFEEYVGFALNPAQILPVGTGESYRRASRNECAFAELFTTDGRIDGLGLTLVEDPGVMRTYNASFTFRNDTLADADPRVARIAEDILANLDDRTMLRLNFEVDLNGREPAAVAREFLASLGLAPAV